MAALLLELGIFGANLRNEQKSPFWRQKLKGKKGITADESNFGPQKLANGGEREMRCNFLVTGTIFGLIARILRLKFRGCTYTCRVHLMQLKQLGRALSRTSKLTFLGFGIG